MKVHSIMAMVLCLCFACSKSDSLQTEAALTQKIDCADSDSPRVENSKDGALLFDPDGAPNTFSQTDLKADVNRYWGNTEAKVFTIPFAKAAKLLQTSSEQAISLKLSDLENPDLVDADWLPLNTAQIAGADGCTAYFNLDKDLMDSFEKAITELNISPDKQTVNAYLGRSKGDVSMVYFMLGVVELHVSALGSSGRGFSASCGAKIPPR